MSPHANAATLSAYLDQELPDPEAQELREHLDDCAACQQRIAGMKNVVASLKHLERMAPSPTLDQLVTRRVALEGEHKSLIDRLEGSLGTFERQSSLLGLFGLVVAFAVMILLFAHALERRKSSLIPVIFQDPVTADLTGGQLSETREIAGRVLHREGEIWVEQGVVSEQGIVSEATRNVTFESAAWRTLLDEHPELAELEKLRRPIVIRIENEVLRLGTGSDSP